MIFKRIFSLVSILFFLNIFSVHAQQWEKKTARLMTPWSEDIDPDNLFDEYPRPQMERQDWVNLNGIWDFLKTDSASIGRYDADANYDMKILVPFPIESALSGVMDTDYTNQNKGYVYKRLFTLPKEMNGKKILLHFGAVDWRCYVYVNGEEVGMHEGGYDPFYFDITSALKGQGEQELVVQIYDPTDIGQPRGKQVVNPHFIWYTPSSGIWQTVWIEGINDSHIRDFTIVPDVDNSCVRLTVNGSTASAGKKVRISVMDGKTQIAQQIVDFDKEAVLKIDNPKLWSPDSPFLYDLKLELLSGSKVVDAIDSYFGMRKIEVGTLRGRPYIYLNNEPFFQYGPLDQGYWPDGLYTPPSYEALYFDLDKTKELGFNMTRKHIKIEPARWYHYCDKIGLLVWQDIPNARVVYNFEGVEEFEYNNWMQQNYYKELTNIIGSLKNYPSIVVWIPFNEGGGQFGGQINHSLQTVNLIRQMDQTRLIDVASGFTDFEIGDIQDRHNYSLPRIADNPYNKRASVCGETGGYGMPVAGHMWGRAGNPYATFQSGEDLLEALIDLNELALIQAADGMCGLVYTEITDVEIEINGFYTYDRKVSKLNADQIARFKSSVEKLYTHSSESLVSTGQQLKNYSTWRYYFGDKDFEPAAGWNSETGFDDTSWSVGLGGFGAKSNRKAVIRTPWDTETIYMRKTFVPEDMTQEQIDNLKLYIFYDDEVEVYINGVLAFSGDDEMTNYMLFDLSPESIKTIRPGEKNLIAVKSSNSSEGQFIDLGLYYEIPLK